MKRVISTLLLAVCCTMTPALMADDHHDAHERARQEQRREWNEREERAYKHYVQQQRHQYREWNKLNAKEQSSYWRWRDKHNDAWVDHHVR